MFRIRAIHSLILEHSAKFNVVDTLAVATILHVPAMYWTDVNGEYPSPNYTNLREVVDRTNLKIQEFNLSIGSSAAPKIHRAGERKVNRGRVYMFEAFREDSKAEMMHLKDNHRFKLMVLILKYFMRGTPRAIQHID